MAGVTSVGIDCVATDLRTGLRAGRSPRGRPRSEWPIGQGPAWGTATVLGGPVEGSAAPDRDSRLAR
ncbi:hypothetical protein [Amycolatopsis sp. YIM 10]|uniref:hypothetical protein n=1 Tax=Amycolatopsis sp. YIM 10 TaxID=2653857 RepID=UPI0012907977|nr:hypothetical protein [Amycolatopsis sp. YIM 10]